MQGKLEAALNVMFSLKRDYLLRQAFEKLVEVTFPVEQLDFSLMNVVQNQPRGSVLLRDAEVLAMLTKLFTMVEDNIGLENVHIQDVLVGVVENFAKLESEVLRLRKLDTPKPPYQMLTDSEHAIMSDHNQQLEMQVESLEAQLQFVKNSKRVNEEKLQKRAEKLAEKVTNLNSLLEQANREKDECLLDLAEKDRALQTTLVHLSVAQEEMKQIIHEHARSKSKDQKETEEINGMIQRQSKFSQAQFSQITAQLDAMRVELKKEKTARAQEREDLNHENILLKKKLAASQSMLDTLNHRIQDISNAGLHNINIQSGAAVEMPRLSSHDQASEKGTMYSDSDGELDENSHRPPQRVPGGTPHRRLQDTSTPTGGRRISSNKRLTHTPSAAIKRKEPAKRFESPGSVRSDSSSSAYRSTSRPRARYYQTVQPVPQEEYQHEGPVKSLRNKQLRQHLQATYSEQRSRSSSPTYRGKHIVYQPGEIQTPATHSSNPRRFQQHSAESTAQRLVYSQSTGVLSPTSKKRTEQQSLRLDDNQRHQQQFLDHDYSDTFSSIVPKKELFDVNDETSSISQDPPQTEQQLHHSQSPPRIAHASQKNLTVNTSPVQLHHQHQQQQQKESQVSVASSSPRMTEYLYDPHMDAAQPGEAQSAVRTRPGSFLGAEEDTSSLSPTSPRALPSHHIQPPHLRNQQAYPHPENSPSGSTSTATAVDVGGGRLYNKTTSTKRYHFTENDAIPEVMSSSASSPLRRSKTSLAHQQQQTSSDEAAPSNGIYVPLSKVTLRFTNQLPATFQQLRSSNQNLLLSNGETAVSLDTQSLLQMGQGNHAWTETFQKKDFLDFDLAWTSTSVSSSVDALSHQGENSKPHLLQAGVEPQVEAQVLTQVIELYNRTIEDYNLLLRTHKEEFAEHERIKADFKEEVYDSVSKIHDLQTRLQTLALENDHLHDLLQRRSYDALTVGTASVDGRELEHHHHLEQQQQEQLHEQQRLLMEAEKATAIAQAAALAAQQAAQQQQQQQQATTTNYVEYQMGLDRSVAELPKVIRIFEDNCNILSGIASEKIVISKLFVWDLVHVLNNVQHSLLRQMQQVDHQVEALQRANRVLESDAQHFKEIQSQHQILTQQHRELQSTSEQQVHQLHKLQALQTQWHSQQTQLQNQVQDTERQLRELEHAHQQLELTLSQHKRSVLEQQEQRQRKEEEDEQEEIATREREEAAQLAVLQGQLRATQQALEDLKQQQQQNPYDDQSLMKLLMETTVRHHQQQQVQERQGLSSSQQNSVAAASYDHDHNPIEGTTHELLPSDDPRYQHDLHFISRMKTRLEHLHELLAQDPKYRQYTLQPASDVESMASASAPSSPKRTVVAKHRDTYHRHQAHAVKEADDDTHDGHHADASSVGNGRHKVSAEETSALEATIHEAAWQKLALEERLLRSEARVQLLTEQLQSMPPSLSVAQAEKRVLEAKLQKALEAHDHNVHKIQQHAVQKIHEITAFLELEKQEKQLLQEKLRDQNETIHQLTHHLKVLQSQQKGTLPGHGLNSSTADLFRHTGGQLTTAEALEILQHQPHNQSQSQLFNASTIAGGVTLQQQNASLFGGMTSRSWLGESTPQEHGVAARAPWEAGSLPQHNIHPHSNSTGQTLNHSASVASSPHRLGGNAVSIGGTSSATRVAASSSAIDSHLPQKQSSSGRQMSPRTQRKIDHHASTRVSPSRVQHTTTGHSPRISKHRSHSPTSASATVSAGVHQSVSNSRSGRPQSHHQQTTTATVSATGTTTSHGREHRYESPTAQLQSRSRNPSALSSPANSSYQSQSSQMKEPPQSQRSHRPRSPYRSATAHAHY